MRCIKTLLIILASIAIAGCAAWRPHTGAKQAASMVDYLYPNAKESPAMTPSVVKLRPPVRVGIAFVPGQGWNGQLPEAARMRLLERVKASFSQHQYIGEIEIIPSQYMRAKGGFENLEQVARMFNVEVVALLSYDQVQFNDANALSVLYWTVIGAYVINGEQYDVQTMVDAAVFDVQSRKLLFRAPGTSQIKGSASLTGLSEKARAARVEGYEKAVDQLIPQLQTQLDGFRERIKNDANYQVENKAGYKGGGAMGWISMALVTLLAGVGLMLRRR